MKKDLKFIRILNNQKGLTLAELMVAVIFLTLVLSVSFSMFYTGNTVYKKGVDQYSLHADIRLASDFIVNATRNVSAVSLTAPASPNTYDKIYVSGKRIVYQPAGGVPVNKTDAIISNSSDLSFSLVASGGKYMLLIGIKGTKDASTFDVDTKILLNNVQSANTGSNYNVIYFK